MFSKARVCVSVYDLYVNAAIMSNKPEPIGQDEKKSPVTRHDEILKNKTKKTD